jgi:hypothetical protein
MLVVSPYNSQMKAKSKKLSQAKHHRWEARLLYAKFRSNLFSILEEISGTLRI